jgi:hypothetical protein
MVGTLAAVPSRPGLAEPLRPGWLTKTALNERLLVPTQVAWQAMPLAEGLDSLAAAHAVCLLRDRRIDPSAPIDIELSSRPLGDALDAVAEAQGASITRLGDVLYFGPVPSAAGLRTWSALHHAQARALPAKARTAWLREAELRWSELAEPREIVADLLSEAGLAAEGLEQIPHDLWSEGHLPPLPLVDRLLLVLVQFDLDFEAADAGKAVRIVPLAPAPVIERKYPGGRDVRRTAERIRRGAPELKVEIRGREVVALGRVEDHEKLNPTRPAAQPRTAAAKPIPADRRYTLRARDVPLSSVLEKLKDETGPKFTFDTVAMADKGISPDVKVTIDVREATLDDLLRTMLEPVGLTYAREAAELRIRPK